MTTNALIYTTGTVALMALLIANASADSSTSVVEPARIYNLASRNFEPNPNYREPAPIRIARQAGEPTAWRTSNQAMPQKPVFKTSKPR